jgi:thiamine biosynthesis lipoprotein
MLFFPRSHAPRGNAYTAEQVIDTMCLRYFLKFFPYILLLIVLFGCGVKKETAFDGATMGTTYHIKIVSGYFKSTSGLKAKIDNRLHAINQSMSTYIPESEISRFNALQGTEEKMHVSQDFFQVLQAGKLLYSMTEGAWDGTVKPLVNLWGFGNTQNPYNVPEQERIGHMLNQIGFHHIVLSEPGEIRKKRTPLSLDLGSIAKGYAVDQIATLIRSQGIDDFLVEIGGEVYAAGFRKDNGKWRVGVNQPFKGARLDALYGIVELQDKAMATSGDYRNYFDVDGKTYSHILDPRTGYPVANGVVSVSITAATCAFADGLATAMMVMGRGKGLALIETLVDVEAFIIVRNPEGMLETYASKGFKIKLRPEEAKHNS